MKKISSTSWNRLAKGYSLLMQHFWLLLLEKSKTVGSYTDWNPNHFTAWYKRRFLPPRLVAAAPLYIRTHSSDGEFIYDKPFAEAAQNLGFGYYPKLTGMSPCSPVPSFDILIDTRWCANYKIDPELFKQQLLAEICRYTSRNNFYGVHLLFIKESFRPAAISLGLSRWQHNGYQWRNQSYSCFDDFTNTLNKNRRKTIRKERTFLQKKGIHVQMFRGHKMPVRWYKRMYEFYRRSAQKFGSEALQYLTKDFFNGLARKKSDKLLFSVAFRAESSEPIAMAMFIIDGFHLLGRYWGCESEVPFLHFECCYYSAIEWAIKHNIQLFNPGMGGDHKTHRGFLSSLDESYHWFPDLRMESLFQGNIHKFNNLAIKIQQEQKELSPIKYIDTV